MTSAEGNMGEPIDKDFLKEPMGEQTKRLTREVYISELKTFRRSPWVNHLNDSLVKSI